MAISTAQDDDVVSDINITPLVDVMLVLMIVFIITTPLLTHSVKVNLPKTAPTQATENQVKPLIVSVKTDGDIYFDQTKVDIKHFEAQLNERKKANDQLALHLNADETVPYGTIAKVLAGIERVGITKLSVITEPKG